MPNIVDSRRQKLKPYHHVRLAQEFKFDCEVWRTFLDHSTSRVACRPMVHLSTTQTSVELNFFSDDSANSKLGYGAVFDSERLFNQ